MAINYPIVNADEDILANDFNTFRKDVIRNAGDYNTTGGSANAQTLTIDSSIGVADIVTGFKVRFKAGFSTTSATPTLNVNSTGAVVLTTDLGAVFPVNGLLADGQYEAVYDSTVPTWKVINYNRPSDDVFDSEAATSLAAGDLVSNTFNDPTKVEKTVLYHFDDGEIANAASNFANPVQCELNAWQGIGLGIDSGNLQAEIQTVLGDWSDVNISGLDDSGISATSVWWARKVTENTVVVAYDNSLVAVSWDGSSLTWGSPQALTSASISSSDGVWLAYVSDGKFLCSYTNGTTASYLVCGTVSGVSISLGTAQTSGSALRAGAKVRCCPLGTTHGVIASEISASTQVEVTRYTITGTALGSAATNVTDDGNVSLLGVLPRNATEAQVLVSDGNDGIRITTSGFILNMRNNAEGSPVTSTPLVNFGTNEGETAYLLPVSEASTSLTLFAIAVDGGTSGGDADQFITTPIASFGTVAANASYSVLSQLGQNHGCKLLLNDNGTIRLYAHYGNLSSIVGMVNATYAEGDDVQVIKSGAVVNLSGLTTNQKYYMAKDGSLTTNRGYFEIGVATSTTTLTLDLKRINNNQPNTKFYTVSDSANDVVNAIWLMPIRDDWSTLTTLFDNSNSTSRVTRGIIDRVSNSAISTYSSAAAGTWTINTADNLWQEGGAEISLLECFNLGIRITFDEGKPLWIQAIA